MLSSTPQSRLILASNERSHDAFDRSAEGAACRKQEPDRRGGAARAARGGERDCRAEKLTVLAALGVGGEAELLDQA